MAAGLVALGAQNGGTRWTAGNNVIYTVDCSKLIPVAHHRIFLPIRRVSPWVDDDGE